MEGLAFSGEVWLEHFSTSQGNIQFEGNFLLNVLIWEERIYAILQKSCWNWVTATLFRRLLDQFPDIFLWQGLERNISSSFIGTLGIVIGSGSWLSNFVLIFCIFIIKKSPNVCVRFLNGSESGYCSCCTGFVRDLMIQRASLDLQYILELFLKTSP